MSAQVTITRRDTVLAATTLAAASALGSGLPLGSLAQAQPLSAKPTMATQSTRRDELSNLPFKESYPTPEASARLYDELQFQRAVPDIGGGGSTFFSGKSMPRSSNSRSRCV